MISLLDEEGQTVPMGKSLQADLQPRTKGEPTTIPDTLFELLFVLSQEAPALLLS